MSEEKEDIFARVKLFTQALHRTCKDKEPDTAHHFVCPICKGNATAIKSGYNGHHRGSCEQCGMSMIE